MPREEEGVFVGQGAFGIDPSRALRVLRERQIDPSVSRMALWVRAAVMRKAARIEFVWDTAELTIRFDGKPFSTEELADPFSGLLEEGGSGETRWLALALLHTALPEVRVRVESGPPGARRAVLQDEEGIRPTKPSTRHADTAVAVSWPFFLSTAGLDHPSRWAPRGLTLEELASCPLRIRTMWKGEKRSPWSFIPMKSNTRRHNAARLRLGKTELLLCVSEGLPGICLRVAPAGVSLGWTATLPSPLSLSVWVDDPGLSLDASLRGPAKDEEFQRVLAAVQEAAGRFVLDVLARHRRSMKLAGGLLASSPALARRWAKQMGGEGSRGLSLSVGWVNAWGPFFPRLSGDAKRVDECVRMTKLLREAALVSLTDRGAGRFLLNEPLFFDDQGRPLTLEDVLPMKQICFGGGSAPASVHQPGRVWELSQTDPVFLHIIRSRNLACPYGT